MRQATQEQIQTVKRRFDEVLTSFLDVSYSARCVPIPCPTPAPPIMRADPRLLLSTHRGRWMARLALPHACPHDAWTRRGRKGGVRLSARWRCIGPFMYRILRTFFVMCARASCGVLVCQNECVERSCKVHSDIV